MNDVKMVYDVYECKWGQKEPRLVCTVDTRPEAREQCREINRKRGCLGVTQTRYV